MAGSGARADTDANSGGQGAGANRPITPFYGSINPFYGSINPFYGSITPFYGSINPFYGSITPFYGSINPFYGNISPFWGDITPFWGNITPFYGSITPFYGNINPFWGNINPFTGSNGAFYATVQPFWQNAGPQMGAINASWDALQASGATDYSSVQSQLNSFVNSSAAFWGAKVQAATNKNFADGFANPMFAKYGIDPTNPASLGNIDPTTRSLFFLNWYDGLMNYAGTDHVDWWMGAVQWSPQLTQIQGLGTNSVIGVLDNNFNSNNSGVQNLQFVGGYQTSSNDHGAAVASLIAAQHDGQDIMGIAPNSNVDIYNPFDATGTASWSDVTQGIYTLYKRGAYVVNASLGVPGAVLTPDWASIMTSSQLSSRGHDLVLVKAAGNEGVMQTANVPWIGNQAPNNLLLVGSVGPSDSISWFSNTPGESCILVNGVCNEQNKLKYRYLVAPGELILVSDNHGGVVRMTGTSFAAPLVTGAVALLQDRWPWLQQHAEETVQIILQSATDLGAPGVDPVYGWGELNVEASQSPLNFNNLVVYQPYTYSSYRSVTTGFAGFAPNSGIFANWSPSSLKSSVLAPGQLALWQNQGAYVVAFENIGSTYRDFQIPLSSLLVGKSQTVNGASNPFQSYLYQRMIDWAHGVKTLGFDSRSTQLGAGDWQLGMMATQSTPDEARRGDGPFHAEFLASNRDAGIELRLGEGSGAHGLMADSGFDQRADFDPATGGVNPVLGFASGGAYASGGIAVTRGLKLSFGFSQKSDDHTYIDPTFGPLQDVPLPTNRASASVVGINYAVAQGVSVSASYTQLNEADGLLGSQGSGAFALSNGARTQGTTLGMTAALANGWQLSGSATLARTTAPQAGSTGLSLAQSGLESTAYEFVAAKSGLFSDADLMRISLTQPLHVESGALRYTALEVIDRDTGAFGPVTQSWNIAGKREYRMEALYGLTLLEGRAEIDGFGLVDLNPPSTPQTPATVTAGAQFRFDL
ncbi:MAG TPA: S8 family peptidase [Rhizomicrobium sp.]